MRPVLDVIRRGFDNVLANWPLLLIRIGESVLVVLIIAIGVMISIVPYLFSGVLDELGAINDPKDFLRVFVFDHPIAILVWVVGVSITLVVAVLVHSFIYGGVVGIYLDGEEAAGVEIPPPRQRFNQFTPERWLSHSRRTMWTIFWIYNIVWGVAGFILLVPLLGAGAFALLAIDSPEKMIALSCASIAFLVVTAFFVSIVAYLWSQLAIIAAVRDSLGVRASIHRGLAILREHLGGVAAVSVILFVISMAVGGAFSGVYFAIGLGSALPAVAIITLPIQIALSLVQSVISVFTSSWLVASLIAAVHD